MRILLFLTLVVTLVFASQVSPNGKCGRPSGSTCLGSYYGDCCSQYGYCGASSAYCGTGCQSGFGRCGTNPSGNDNGNNGGGKLTPSRSGKCGKGTGATCIGYNSQDTCCSQYGWCGGSNAHCGTGCQKDFGECRSSRSSSAYRVSSSTRAASSPARSSTLTSVGRTSVKTSSTRTTRSSSTRSSVSSYLRTSSVRTSGSSSIGSSSTRSASTSTTSTISTTSVNPGPVSSTSVVRSSSSLVPSSVESSTSGQSSSSVEASSSILSSSSAALSSSADPSPSSSASLSSLSSSNIPSATSSSASASLSPTCTSTLVNVQVSHDGACSGICDTIAIISGSCQTVSFDAGTSICTYRLFDGLCPSASVTPTSSISSPSSSVIPSTDSSVLMTSSTEPSLIVSSTPGAASPSAPVPSPTIVNGGFDVVDEDGSASPWSASPGVGLNGDPVIWARSPPNVGFFNGEGRLQQTINFFDPTKSYRIVYYFVKFDTPDGSCTLVTRIGNQQIGAISLIAPRTPNDQFQQMVSSIFQTVSTSLTLTIQVFCPLGESGYRTYVDDVSIVEVTV